MADKPETQLPSLSIDWELYAEYLKDTDLTEEQQQDLIVTLWNIAVAFVDLGFGIHPVQQACEQNAESGIFLPQDLLNLDAETPNPKTSPKLADHDVDHIADKETP